MDSSLNFICGQQRIFSNIIDTKCSKYAPLVSTSLVAASSLNAFYSDLPTTGVPIRGPFGTQIALDYANLFTVDLEYTLSAGGLGGLTFWSFGDGNGNAAADTCSNGEDDGSLSTLGATGNTALKNQASWFATDIRGCAELHKVLCLCYVPSSGGG
ncbi:putative lipoprotein [Leptospira johnsonii]|uniref:Putative lipoprotein n=1 Tax=Leptospira johnsonii TaxID=1917820 RepID=A0A2P2D2J6_9LEPT|nr:putative lipoprotein [Leptospira johnsonii]